MIANTALSDYGMDCLIKYGLLFSGKFIKIIHRIAVKDFNLYFAYAAIQFRCPTDFRHLLSGICLPTSKKCKSIKNRPGNKNFRLQNRYSRLNFSLPRRLHDCHILYPYPLSPTHYYIDIL